uniref:Uncharacterized protein n=1 Tax=Haptolina brevifila TaxID=156173 RepID=A0A7S2GU76_9EUKA
MVRLQPSQADVIVQLLREANSDLTTFCRLVRLQIGGALVFDSVMLLRGLPVEVPRPKRIELFEHAICCRANDCSYPGCAEIRTMFNSLHEHAWTCSVPDCRTCTQHQKVRDAMRRARARDPPARPIAASPVVPEVTPHDAASGLNLLAQAGHMARSALGDLPTSSPRNSPCTSPNASPKPQRHKRAKKAPSVLRAPGQPVLARAVLLPM